LLKDLLPAERGRKSRPAGDNRPVVNGILWRMRTSAPWRDLPEKYGKWRPASGIPRRRFWAQAMADDRRHSIDSTTVRGHVSIIRGSPGLVLALRGGPLGP
jgi:transposase